MAADFEQIAVSIRLFFTEIVYLLNLDKGCRILYAFDLNSMVCRHIADVHLSSGQVIYDLRMDVDFYNTFLLCLRINSF